MTDRETGAPVTIQELLITTLAQSDAMAKLLIEKGIITRDEFMARLSKERGAYQNLMKRIGKGTDAENELATRDVL